MSFGEDAFNGFYNTDSGSTFRVRSYDDIFFPEIEFKQIQESLENENIILDEEEIKNRNLDFNFDIEGSGINREIGGDVVGNGGGSLEHFAYYFFYGLPELIESSLAQTVIFFDRKERLLLNGIRYAMSEMTKEGKLVFAKGSEYESFFYSPELDRAPRMAKTGFSIDYPIYINVDQAYAMANTNPRYWIALLIHELGHQIGFADHTYLDQLGNKVLSATTFDTDTISVSIPGNKEIKLTVQNYSHRRGISDLYLTLDNRIMSVQQWKSTTRLKNICKGMSFHDAKIENLHWESRGEVVTQGLFRVQAKGWMKVNCKNEHSGSEVSYTRDIVVTINSGIGGIMLSGNVKILDQ